MGRLILIIALVTLFSSCSESEEPLQEDVSTGLYILDKSDLEDWDDGFINYDATSITSSIYVLSKENNLERLSSYL